MQQKELGDFRTGGVDCPICTKTTQSIKGMGHHFSSAHPSKNVVVEQHGEETIRDWYVDKGVSENALSKHLGVSRYSMKRAIEHLGIDRRGQSEAEKEKWRKMSETQRKEQVAAAHERTRELVEEGEFALEKYWNRPENDLSENGKRIGAIGTELRETNGMAGATGQDNPNWRGGKSIYDSVKKQLPGPSWKDCGEDARESADYTCEMCGTEQENLHRILDVHHIVPVLSGGTNDEWNRIALCASCHHKAEWYGRKNIPELDPLLIE